MIRGITEFWGWFEPGVRAVAPLAPLLSLALTAVIATAAYFTFRLRTRVDHVDQWWKQVNVAVEKGLMEDVTAREIADHILESLQSRAMPKKPAYLHQPWGWRRDYFGASITHHKALRDYKKDARKRWRISDREERLLIEISTTFARRALAVSDGGANPTTVDNGSHDGDGDLNV